MNGIDAESVVQIRWRSSTTLTDTADLDDNKNEDNADSYNKAESIDIFKLIVDLQSTVIDISKGKSDDLVGYVSNMIRDAYHRSDHRILWFIPAVLAVAVVGSVEIALLPLTIPIGEFIRESEITRYVRMTCYR